MSEGAKRLRWRCRRGMRELDVLLEAYLERRSPTMTANQTRVFERFLDATGMDLYAWLTRRTRPPDAEFVDLVDDILDTRGHASSSR